MVSDVLGLSCSSVKWRQCWLPTLCHTVSLVAPWFTVTFTLTVIWFHAKSSPIWGFTDRPWVPVQHRHSADSADISFQHLHTDVSFSPSSSIPHRSLLQNTSWNSLGKLPIYLSDDWNMLASQWRHCPWLDVIYAAKTMSTCISY